MEGLGRMGRVFRHCWNWAAGLALVALLLQSFGPLARGVDSHYRHSLWEALNGQALASPICKAPSAAAAMGSQSMAPGETGVAALMTDEEKASLTKKLRCPCVYGSHSCAYCVTYCFSLALFCLLAAGVSWLLRLLARDMLFPLRREVAARLAFRLSLSPRAPPFFHA